jgi:hypothetical protein
MDFWGIRLQHRRKLTMAASPASGAGGTTAVRVNPLSVSKGKKYECEMCGKPATLACPHCRVTYYW